VGDGKAGNVDWKRFRIKEGDSRGGEGFTKQGTQPPKKGTLDRRTYRTNRDLWPHHRTRGEGGNEKQ